MDHSLIKFVKKNAPRRRDGRDAAMTDVLRRRTSARHLRVHGGHRHVACMRVLTNRFFGLFNFA